MANTAGSYIPSIGDRVKIVGLHNDDHYSKIPDKILDKEFEILSAPRCFREGTWGFGATDEDVVFFAAFIEPVFQTELQHA